MTDIASEINLLNACDYEHIVKLLGYYVENKTSSMYIYLSFDIAMQDLDSYIQSEKHEIVTPGRISKIMQCIFRGLAYIHGKDIVHRDIKPKNILIFDKNTVRICDFGLAISQKSPSWNYRSTGCGTRAYLAPEMFFETYNYGTAIDIWGAGCCLYELANG